MINLRYQASVMVMLILTVHSQTLVTKHEEFISVSSWYSTKPTANAISLFDPVDLVADTETVDMLASTLVSILKSAFYDSHSLMLLHDDSEVTGMVLQILLASKIDVPLQNGEMMSLQTDPKGTARFLSSHRNVEDDPTLIMFANHTEVKSFMEAGSTKWFLGPVLFVSLQADAGARKLLMQAGSVRRASMLIPEFMSTGRARYSVTTYQPFNPSKFSSEILDLSKPVTRDLLFKERYPNFQGHRFQLASWIDDFPYLFYNSDKKVDGIGQAMLKEISFRMNFTYELQEIPPDGYWGELINGTWVGMLGQVVRKEKDFIINGFAVVLDRYKAADFTVPYFTDSYSITLQVPPPFPRWLSIVYPFDGWVWLGLIIALLVLAAIFHFLIRKDHSYVYDNKFDLVSTLVWIASPLLYKPATKVPDSWGCRVFLGGWWIASLVLSTSYMGNLIAFLTVPTQTRRIATLEELANSEVRINMLDYGNFVPGYLWSAKEPVLHLLGKKLSLLPDYDQIMDAFDTGVGVLEASEYSRFLFINRKRSENSYAVEEKLFPNFVAWAFQKGSPYKHIFDRYLERMSHSGLVEHWRQSVVDDFRRSKGQAPGGIASEGETKLEPLTLEHLQGSFIILGLGTLLALIVLLLEILVFHSF